MKKIALLLALSALTFSSNVVAGNLTGDELRVLLVGNTLYGQDWDQVLREDGNTESKWGSDSDTGKYWITDDGKYCRQWTKWGDGKELCGTVNKSFNGYKYRPDGEGETWNFKVEEGFTRGYN